MGGSGQHSEDYEANKDAKWKEWAKVSNPVRTYITAVLDLKSYHLQNPVSGDRNPQVGNITR